MLAYVLVTVEKRDSDIIHTRGHLELRIYLVPRFVLLLLLFQDEGSRDGKGASEDVTLAEVGKFGDLWQIKKKRITCVRYVSLVLLMAHNMRLPREKKQRMVFRE
jgi:hypothetical protein